MKKLAILAVVFTACTKYKPDWDQANCQMCVDYVEYFSDSTSQGLVNQIGEPDTLLYRSLCDTKPDRTNYNPVLLSWFKQNCGVFISKQCNAAGELIHWKKETAKILYLSSYKP